jgi:hypothetical protein
MADMSDLLPLTPSIEQLSNIIGSVAAPAFLLGAVAAFISVLMSRMNPSTATASSWKQAV